MDHIIRIQFDDGYLSICKLAGDYVDVSLKISGLSAEVRSYVYSDWNSLKDFFSKMVEKFSGWDEELSWKSVEKDFVLSAKHDGLSKIGFKVLLKSDQGLSSWTVESLNFFDLGQLTAIQDQL